MNTQASDARAKRAALAGIDAACWGVAGLVLLGARYDFTLNLNQWQSVAGYLAVAMVSMVVLGYIFQLYRGRYRVGSMDETILLGAVVASAAVIAGLGFLWVPGFARGLVISVPPAALLLMQFFRLAIRVDSERKRVSKPSDRRTLIYGAGDAGTQLLRLISINSNPPFNVVGFIDDDPAKRHRHIGSVGVLGNGEQLLDVIADKHIDTVILAITNATGDLIGELSNQLDLAGVKLLILPPLRDMIHGQVSLSQLHEVDVNDILGRQANHTDLQAIADYLNDKVVLITGAGGSIGSEIARQVHRFGPRELVLLDRDESALHAVQLSIYGVGLLDTRDMVLCDIRDVAALDAVFAEHRPQVVFHAAALKHLPMPSSTPRRVGRPTCWAPSTCCRRPAGTASNGW